MPKLTRYKKDLFKYRNRVHTYLDKIWLASSKKYYARNTMYNWLSIQMGLTREETHISKFDISKCLKAIKILRPKYIQMYGQDLNFKELEMKIQVKGTEIFETAHILPKTDNSYDGLYSRTYKITVTVEGTQTGPYNMVIPQEELKSAIKHIVPDRKFIFCKTDPVCKEIALILDKYGIPYLELDNTVIAENLVKYIEPLLKNYIYDDLGYKNIKIVSIELSSLKDDYSVKLID